MCDYSLMEFPSRLANEGDLLVIHRFQSGCLGLTTPTLSAPNRKPAGRQSFWRTLKSLFLMPDGPPATAVCIPPGARLVLHDVPAQIQKALGVNSQEPVRFVQISAAENQYRDAVHFRTGHTLRLQELAVGQRVEVLNLGDNPEEEWDSSGRGERVSARRA